MKKLLILFLFPLLVMGQTHWGDSLVKFERVQSKKTFGWFDSLTATKKTNYINEWTSLKIKVAIEQRLQNISDSTSADNFDKAEKQAYIAHLKTLGFVLTGNEASLQDWELVYNHPEIFGEYWHTHALTAYQTKNFKEFLAFCKNLNL